MKSLVWICGFLIIGIIWASLVFGTANETTAFYGRTVQNTQLRQSKLVPIYPLRVQPTNLPTDQEQSFHPADAQCPVSTMECIPCNAGEQYCRYEPGAGTGNLGWACQNNNPGNIRYSSYRINLITSNGGPAPCGERESVNFMIFPTYGDGKEALRAYIKAVSKGQHVAYPECGNCTLSYFFSKYAPAADQNDPDSYSNKVAQRIGVSTSTTLNWVVNNKLNEFADAIQWHEGWFAIDPEVREEVQQMLYDIHDSRVFFVFFRHDTTEARIAYLQQESQTNTTRIVSNRPEKGYKVAVITVNHEGHLEEAMTRYGSDLDVLKVSPSYVYMLDDPE